MSSELLKKSMCRRVDVLDDGFVRLVDFMGSDQAIVQAARVSYGAGTKTISDDRKLIRYLIRNRHTSPIEMCEVKFHMRVPMDIWRHIVRHRTASINEYSTRYSEAIDSQHMTNGDKWRTQSKQNKQGSEGLLPAHEGAKFSEDELVLIEESKKIYQKRLDAGIAREQARKDLPLSTYTEAYFKIDLHNLFHLLNLRMKAETQLETRDYAWAMFELIRPLFPLAAEAFMNYQYQAITFSKEEQELLGIILTGRYERLIPWMDEHEWRPRNERGKFKIHRERNEFLAKLRIIAPNLTIDWKN